MNEYPKIVDNLIWIDEHNAYSIGTVPQSLVITNYTGAGDGEKYSSAPWQMRFILPGTRYYYIFYKTEKEAKEQGLKINKFMQDAAKENKKENDIS